jgi:hypothetical protein
LVWLDQPRQVHFNETGQSIARTIEYTKGAPRPATSPALQVVSDECFHRRRRAPPTAYPLRHLLIFTSKVLGCILRTQRPKEDYSVG